MVTDELGACLGIPGITAHQAVFNDGPIRGKTILVHGVLGAVSSVAAQLSLWGGATVVGTVMRAIDLGKVDAAIVSRCVSLDGSDMTSAIRQYAPRGVDRIVEVNLSGNADLDSAVVANGAVYASRAERPELPFWPLLFANISVRLLGSDDFPAEAKRRAAADLTAAARIGAPRVRVAPQYPLAQIATAHDHVDDGPRDGRVLLAIPT